jgi:hypothetical protein
MRPDIASCIDARYLTITALTAGDITLPATRRHAFEQSRRGLLAHHRRLVFQIVLFQKD